MIIINSTKYQLESTIDLYNLLEDKGYDPKMVVVEVDKKLVKRDEYKSFMVKDGMKIEVFSFIGGG